MTPWRWIGWLYARSATRTTCCSLYQFGVASPGGFGSSPSSKVATAARRTIFTVRVAPFAQPTGNGFSDVNSSLLSFASLSPRMIAILKRPQCTASLSLAAAESQTSTR